MGIKIVRTPSETPNITNVDDIIPFRYAYGNQNGYVIGRGSQLDGSYESGEFTVGSGRAVIQGVEVDIDANGISTTLDTASETRYFKIYLKVNLVNEVAELESYYSTVSYDEITDPTSSDLISGGDAYLLLYTLQLSGTTQVAKTKIVKSITYRDAETINGVSITQDNNGVLHTGEEIICKKKLLWSGNIDFTGTRDIQFPNAIELRGKTLEVVFRCYTNYWGYNHSTITTLTNTNMQQGLFYYHTSQNEILLRIAIYENYIRFSTEGAQFGVTKIYEIIE